MFWIRVSIGGLGFVLAVTWYTLLRFVPVSNAFRRKSFARVMARLVTPPVGIRLTIVGRDRVGRHVPCVYASNHQSQIDYPIVGHIFPDDTLIMASQIGDWPFMGMLFRSSGSIALDRDVPVRAAAALDEAERAIRDDGLSVWMFAEGTRGKVAGTLGPFKRGAFRLAARTGVPVIPVVISPLKPETDLRGRRLSPHDVTLQVLDPVYANGPTREDEDELRDEVRRRMQHTLSAHYGTPAMASPRRQR
ncbi:MAG: lysophospholipid acyltransferase family protein [Gemmatimonadaceae bacterium]